MMRIVAVTVMFVIACGSSTPAPAPPSNQVAEPELRCKTAVLQASTAVKLRPKDVTMAIGECEQKEWSRPARTCVDSAHSSADLVTCGTTFELGKHGIFASHRNFEDAMAEMAQFRDQMCACKDTACAQHVSDDMTKWGQKLAKEQSEPPQFSEEDTRRATEIGETMGKCMQHAMGAP